jgi:cation diffusion facilitator CzcD-associated flavoprotein CzcO
MTVEGARVTSTAATDGPGATATIAAAGADRPVPPTPEVPAPHVEVAVVGAGFGGIAAAVRLHADGIDDFVVFERAADVGGTWRDNTYPGCACDVPSVLYSLSFAQEPHWSRSFPQQQELWDYLRRVTDRFGLRSRIRFDHEVTDLRWDGADHRWVLRTSQGTWTAGSVVVATGPLSEPSLPDIPGIAAFSGQVFHSARWDHDYDLTGKRVAVIGTGASAIQFVPQIAGKVAHLDLFQRTPPWLIPRIDRKFPAWRRALYRRLPITQRLARAGVFWARELLLVNFVRPGLPRVGTWLAKAQLRRQVRDRALRKKLTPDYRLGCKRVLVSSNYYPALTLPQVQLVTERIARIEPWGVRTADGTEHRVDAIIFGTGFHTVDLPVAARIHDSDGRTLAEHWKDGPRAYRGTTVTGFPNLFLMLGPNSGLGHTSVVLMLEAQLEHVVRALRHLRRTGATALEPAVEAVAAENAELDRLSAGTVWTSGGCQSWYLDDHGRNFALWPRGVRAFQQRCRDFDPGSYTLVAPRAAALPQAARAAAVAAAADR